MVRPEVTGKRLPAAADEADAFSIAEFCRRHRISPQLFYKFKNQMPKTFRVGSRVLISREAAARWRAERELASAAKTVGTRHPANPPRHHKAKMGNDDE